MEFVCNAVLVFVIAFYTQLKFCKGIKMLSKNMKRNQKPSHWLHLTSTTNLCKSKNLWAKKVCFYIQKPIGEIEWGSKPENNDGALNPRLFQPAIHTVLVGSMFDDAVFFANRNDCFLSLFHKWVKEERKKHDIRTLNGKDMGALIWFNFRY